MNEKKLLKKRNCLRCDEAMDIGVLLEKNESAVYKPVLWLDGVPEYHGMWGGYGVNIKRSRKLDVFAFRCPTCGMLEAVALDGDMLLTHEGEQEGEISLAEGGVEGGLSES